MLYLLFNSNTMSNSKFVFSLLILFCLLASIISCTKNSLNISDRLIAAEQIIEQKPDSALSILNSINDPYSLNEKAYNKFFLLQIQAKDKAYKNITNDTTIFRVRKYYVEKFDIKNATLSSYYCGRIFQEQNNDKQALNEYQIAERYGEMINDNNLNGLIQSAIGAIFLNHFIEKEALKYFFHAAQYFNAAKNNRNEIVTYNQMGNAYLMMSMNDSAFYYYKKGFNLAEISKDSLQMANITQCMGIAYREIGDFMLAKKYFRQAEKYTANVDYRAKLYLNLSKNFHEMDMPDSAKFYIDKSLAVIQKEDIYLFANIYKTLSQIAEKQNDYNSSLNYYKKYTEYLEQIVDENKNAEILELQKKYKYELLKNENNSLKIQKQKIFLISIAIVGLLVIVATFFYKKSIDNKKNILKKENEILCAEKKIYQLIEMSNTYNEREDSIKSILLHHFDILKKAALLKSLKSEDEQNYRLIKKVNEIVYGQESFNWSTFYQHMNKINDDLFERLRIKYPQLDETEFRVCCLTYAKLTCSEIGIILDLSPNTIQMKRSSIRKKLGVEAQGNIQVHIDEKI